MTRTWLDDVTAVYGEPRIRVDDPVRMEDDSGGYWKSGWVWFPSNANHNIGIREYRRWAHTTYSTWVVNIGSHLREMPSVEWRGRTEPDDVVMNQLMAVTGFLSTPVKKGASA